MNRAIGGAVWRRYRWHIVSFLAGVVVGVMFAGWLRGVVTVLFLAGVAVALYFVWTYFEDQKRR